MGNADILSAIGFFTLCVYICCVVFRASVAQREKRERRARNARHWLVTGSADITEDEKRAALELELGTTGGRHVPEEGGQ
jgi:hypothetical protein